MKVEVIDPKIEIEHIQKEELISFVSECINYLLNNDPNVSVDQSRYLKVLNSKQKKLDLQLKKYANLKNQAERKINELNKEITHLKNTNQLKIEDIYKQLNIK